MEINKRKDERKMSKKKKELFPDPPDEAMEPYPGLFIGDPNDHSVPPFGDYDLRAAAEFSRKKWEETGEIPTQEEFERFRIKK